MWYKKISKGDNMYKIQQILKQDANQDMVVLDKVFDILNHVSTRVVLVEDTPKHKKYSVAYGVDKASIVMTDTQTIIGISCNNQAGHYEIVHSENNLNVKTALEKLQKQLSLQSKLEHIINRDKKIIIQPKTLPVSAKVLEVENKTLRVASTIRDVSSR